jgi:hypothetical protein
VFRQDVVAGGIFPRGKAAGEGVVKLTIHLHLVPRLKMVDLYASNYLHVFMALF